jgi:hypothetical protein
VGNNTTMMDRWVKSQIRTLGRLCWFFEALFPGADILGHRDMPGTATLCPGLDVRELLGLDQEGVVSSVKPA